MDHGSHTFYLAFEWLRRYPTAITARDVDPGAVRHRGQLQLQPEVPDRRRLGAPDVERGRAQGHLHDPRRPRRDPGRGRRHRDRDAGRPRRATRRRTIDAGTSSARRSPPTGWTRATSPGSTRCSTTSRARSTRRDFVGKEAREAFLCVQLIATAYASAREGCRELPLGGPSSIAGHDRQRHDRAADRRTLIHATRHLLRRRHVGPRGVTVVGLLVRTLRARARPLRPHRRRRRQRASSASASWSTATGCSTRWSICLIALRRHAQHGDAVLAGAGAGRRRRRRVRLVRARAACWPRSRRCRTSSTAWSRAAPASSSDAGEVFDAAVDRYIEFFLLGGLIVLLPRHLERAAAGAGGDGRRRSWSATAPPRPRRCTSRRRAAPCAAASARSTCWSAAGLTSVTKVIFADTPTLSLREAPMILAIAIVAGVANVSVLQRLAAIIRRCARATPIRPRTTPPPATGS